MPQPLSRYLAAARSWLPFVALLGVTQCIAGPIWIPSGSMLPTMQVGDVLFVNRVAYNFHLPLVSTAEVARWKAPARGDVVVFNAPSQASSAEALFIKRVAAVAGDTIEVRNQRIILNGQPAQYEQHPASAPTEQLGGVRHPVSLAPSPLANFGPYTVPAGHVFVLGDNRDNSADSRVWGPLALERVRGKAVYRLAGLNPSQLRAPGAL